MVAAPFNTPETNPVVMIFNRPGTVVKVNPFHNMSAREKTTMAMAIRMDFVATWASKYTPTGVPMSTPMNNQDIEFQCICRQTWGISHALATTSSTRMTGTTSAGGITIERLITAIMEKPKPLYPRMIAANRIAAPE